PANRAVTEHDVPGARPRFPGRANDASGRFSRRARESRFAHVGTSPYLGGTMQTNSAPCRRAFGIVLALGVIAVSIAPRLAAADPVAPNPLLSIDQHRTTVVERIAAT